MKILSTPSCKIPQAWDQRQMENNILGWWSIHIAKIGKTQEVLL